MQIIKDGLIVEDDWRHLADDETVPAAGRYTVSSQRWLAEHPSLASGPDELGLRLRGEDKLEDLADDLGYFALIVIEFPTMADGRGFTLARLLRERYGYRGEIRARGEYIRDQIFFMSRVGINAFQFGEEQSLESLLPALSEFTVRYQAAVDQPLPLYRRRG
ncbi:DUF934 domain-containing protein [Methylococcus sp. EFPC2]|uniref:DUF934 domain-containing protein n=1 Tax=Methylococcus sp. EFPC2 TaxID=2812648 RepID=UPI0019685043|nr:DUF934 domain-containing protein [Methylococcus sp. EFPC2]QSA95582.1 DUF934 domain-containing protein [Methylococcus sp. EFPC2]